MTKGSWFTFYWRIFMNVTSIRISREIQKAMDYVSKAEKIEKVQSLRKLAQIGFEAYLAKAYQAGKISIREAGRYLNLSLSETMDLFADLGIKGNVLAKNVLDSLKSLQN